LLQGILDRGNRLAAAGHRSYDKGSVTKLDAQNRAFNPLMDKTSTLFNALKKIKKKKRKREEDA
jgi:hypothetical protein